MEWRLLSGVVLSKLLNYAEESVAWFTFIEVTARCRAIYLPPILIARITLYSQIVMQVLLKLLK